MRSEGCACRLPDSDTTNKSPSSNLDHALWTRTLHAGLGIFPNGIVVGQAPRLPNPRAAIGAVALHRSASVLIREQVFALQPDRMPRVKSAGRAVRRVPTRRPFTRVTIEWRRVEPEPGNNCERMTLTRVDRDPFARAAFAIAAELS